jgi:hypothetical protein
VWTILCLASSLTNRLSTPTFRISEKSLRFFKENQNGSIGARMSELRITPHEVS